MRRYRGVRWLVPALALIAATAWWRWDAVRTPPVGPAAAAAPPARGLAVPPPARPLAVSSPAESASAAPSATAPLTAARPAAPASRPAVPPSGAVAARAAASRPLRPGEYEVCGHGIVQGQPADPAAAGRPADWLPPKEFEARWQAEVEAWLPRLASRAAPDVEAAVAVLQGRSADLVRLALRDRHARTVQWAVQACATGSAGPPDPACLMLPSRLWTEVEPDNGLAWLYLMAAEPAAHQDAFHGLSRARRFDERTGALVSVLDAAASPELPRHLRLNLQILAFNTELTRAPPDYALLLRQCPAEAVHDANRREPCLAVAELLAGQSGTVLARTAGLRLGERGGWPPERVSGLRRQIDTTRARLAARLDRALHLPLLSCAQFETLGSYITEVGRQGEWGLGQRPAPPGR